MIVIRQFKTNFKDEYEESDNFFEVWSEISPKCTAENIFYQITDNEIYKGSVLILHNINDDVGSPVPLEYGSDIYFVDECVNFNAMMGNIGIIFQKDMIDDSDSIVGKIKYDDLILTDTILVKQQDVNILIPDVGIHNVIIKNDGKIELSVSVNYYEDARNTINRIFDINKKSGMLWEEMLDVMVLILTFMFPNDKNKTNDVNVNYVFEHLEQHFPVDNVKRYTQRLITKSKGLK